MRYGLLFDEQSAEFANTPDSLQHDNAEFGKLSSGLSSTPRH